MKISFYFMLGAHKWSTPNELKLIEDINLVFFHLLCHRDTV